MSLNVDARRRAGCRTVWMWIRVTASIRGILWLIRIERPGSGDRFSRGVCVSAFLGSKIAGTNVGGQGAI